MVDDGTPGGIRRAIEYLVDEWNGLEGAPRVDRLALRGEGSLRAAVPVFGSALARTALRLLRDRPRLIHLNVTQRGSTARAFAIVFLARAGRVPVVIHLHSSAYDAFLRSVPSPARWPIRWMFQSAARVVVLGDGWATSIQSALEISVDRVLVLPNAVPGPPTTPRRQHEGPVRLLFLGQLGHRKGVPDLIEALGRLDGLAWQAVFAGDGEQQPYRARAGALGIADRITFTGWVDAGRVRAELRDADILLLPSHAEGLPLAVLEGMAYGLAVIATPVGAVPEVVRNGETALLFPPGDVDALAACLRCLLTDRPLRERLGVGARAAWERSHDIQAYARRVAALYDEVAPPRL